MIVKVLIDTGVKKLNKVYDYLVNEDIKDQVVIGKRVSVNFGKGKGIKTEGVIVKTEEVKEKDVSNLKYVTEILDDISYIDKDKLKLAKWMAKMYFCNVYTCLKIMFPRDNSKKLSKKSIEKIKDMSLKLSKPIDEIKNDILTEKIKSPKHIILLNFLIENTNILNKDAVNKLNISQSIINTLVKNGYIKKEETEETQSSLEYINYIKDTKKQPTKEQNIVISKLTEKIKAAKFNESIIYGVTGSGKTEVYLQLIQECLNENKTAIVLVPEIALTPQAKARFISRFGGIVSVIHSDMRLSKRKEEIKKIIEGKTKIVIGPRSALFVPIKNIGLIIIDEQHDLSYISQMNPRYDTKEVARWICAKNSALFIQGSATPLISTMYEARTGKIDLYTLLNRANEKSELPEIILIDMKEIVLEDGQSKILSNKLIKEISKNINNKQQTFIFINRRGYNSYVYCKNCGKIIKCKNCDVNLTYHKTSNILLCHYCSFCAKATSVCPYCNLVNTLIDGGIGTEKVVEELERIFKDATILRMDKDTTIKRNSSEKILTEFVNKKIDILVGTQMISKGHDIDNVTLVGIINADSLFFDSSFLTNERAFANLLQVSGRAGRGNLKGRAIVQCFDTDNYVFESLVKNDYMDFYNNEIKYRELANYPPYSDIFIIELTSKDKLKLEIESVRIYEFLNSAFSKYNKDNDPKIIIHSPKAPYISKISNKYRIQMVIKTKICDKVYDTLYENIEKYDKILARDINITVSKNPINI